MKDPLGVSPSKGNQETTRGKEKILLISVGIEPTASFNLHFRVNSLSVNSLSWVRFPPRSKEFFLYLVWFPDSLY